MSGVAGLGSDPGIVDLSDPAAELCRLADRLDPALNRDEVVRGFETVFRSGIAPDPWPEGPLTGRLLVTTSWTPWDRFVLGVSRQWMPWLGKAFDPATHMGVNRFRRTTATSVWLRALFPTHPQVAFADRIEAFPFHNRVGPGVLDPDVRVLKIDYDFEANPGRIRRILDEIVQVAPGCYLGKILFRMGDRFHRIGFFTLQG
jgi:hypothetical protein